MAPRIGPANRTLLNMHAGDGGALRDRFIREAGLPARKGATWKYLSVWQAAAT